MQSAYISIPSVIVTEAHIRKVEFLEGSTGDGSTVRLSPARCLSRDFESSVSIAKQVAENFTGLRFYRDPILRMPCSRLFLQGDSAGLMMTLGFISLLNRVPIRPDLTGTGRIGLFGTILQVGDINEKVSAAKEAGYRSFLLPYQSCRIVADGMSLRRVATITEAWQIARAR